MGILREVKCAIEGAFGVAILRTAPSKHFYPILSALRPWTEKDVIFDVGANDGRTVEALRRTIAATPRIFAFEPTSATFRILRERTARYANVAVFPFALGAEPAQATINLYEQSVMNSLTPRAMSAVGVEPVEVRTVDLMMRELGVEFVHFLKIDTEGYEMEVLKGARRALEEARIAFIQAEFHCAGAEGLERLEELRLWLHPFGYELFGIYNQTHQALEPDGWAHAGTAGYRPLRLAYADAVFVYAGRGQAAGRGAAPEAAASGSGEQAAP